MARPSTGVDPTWFKSATVRGSTIFVLVVGLGAMASAVANSPERDPAAISTLQSAITALGGSNALAAIQDCILTGSILHSDGTSKDFKWTIAGSEFRQELASANDGTNIFLSGHGSPAWVVNGSTLALNYYVARANPPRYLPAYVLFQELNNSVFTLKYIGAVQLNGRNVLQVHISDDSDALGTLVTPQEWYFDPVSFLPLRVQFREPPNENASNYVNAAFDMSQYVPFSGVLVPSTILYSQDNAANETITIGTVTFNSGVSPSVFDAPQGGGQ